MMMNKDRLYDLQTDWHTHKLQIFRHVSRHIVTVPKENTFILQYYNESFA